ncbi:MAG: type I restriction endonuclease subunit R [Chloroflexi bacterium]|nr:type I restriction endonuclease subunit R [Chloroflexota bacterium]
MSEPNLYDWQLAEVIVNRRAMFVLWAIKTLFCTRKSDFLGHYQITDDELTRLLNKLLVQGFVQQDGQEYVLTELGEKAVSYLGELQISQFAQLARETAEVDTRFAPVREGQEAKRGQIERPTEATLVEEPLIHQLQDMGWEYINGNPAPAPETEVPVVGLVGVPLFTERSSFREVLLEKRLRNALYNINTTEDGQRWLDEQRIEQAVEQLRRVQTTTGQLMQTNQETMDLLLKGTRVAGDAQLHDGRNVDIKYIDFEHPYDNNFLIINQFRVDLPGLRYIVPDIVLFVNGIPLVVIECKHPALTNPIEEGIRQLLRYSGQGGASSEQDDMPAAEQLFNFNHLLISTCFYQARFATIGASYEHYQEWKDPYPLTEHQLAQHLGVDAPSSQQQLVAGMLSKENLLDLLYNFTLFVTIQKGQEKAGRTG